MDTWTLITPRSDGGWRWQTAAEGDFAAEIGGDLFNPRIITINADELTSYFGPHTITLNSERDNPDDPMGMPLYVSETDLIANAKQLRPDAIVVGPAGTNGGS